MPHSAGQRGATQARGVTRLALHAAHALSLTCTYAPLAHAPTPVKTVAYAGRGARSSSLVGRTFLGLRWLLGKTPRRRWSEVAVARASRSGGMARVTWNHGFTSLRPDHVAIPQYETIQRRWELRCPGGPESMVPVGAAVSGSPGPETVVPAFATVPQPMVPIACSAREPARGAFALSGAPPFMAGGEDREHATAGSLASSRAMARSFLARKTWPRVPSSFVLGACAPKLPPPRLPPLPRRTAEGLASTVVGARTDAPFRDRKGAVAAVGVAQPIRRRSRNMKLSLRRPGTHPPPAPLPASPR